MPLKFWAIVFLTILAPALGGSVQLWPQAFLACGTGVLFLVAPPRRRIGKSLELCLTAILLLALIPLLPANWFPPVPWRGELLKRGAILPSTWSPQPLLTLQWTCLFAFGLAWTYYLFSQTWEGEAREKSWDGYCLGILGLAAVLVTAYALKWRVPFWPNVPEYGFFPNRNQTSNVLGLGGVMIYANAFQHLERGRRRGWMWLAGLGLICWALILNYSRAGIILFFAGALAWHIWWLARSDSRDAAPRAIAWGPLTILLGLLLIAGGDTLIRFRNSTDLLFMGGNARMSIQHDAWSFFTESPVIGVGLGNFRGLFSTHRQFFVSTSEAIHPESDWLWMAIEMGGVAPLVVLTGLGIWIARCFPFAPGTWRGMRAAAMICAIGFVIHGFFDVSAHRIGSVWPALFLAATAMNSDKRQTASRFGPSIFRGVGLALIGAGVWWFSSIFTGSPLSSATVERVSARIPIASASGQSRELLALTSEGLRIAPLDWNFYYNRGLAEALLVHPRAEILRDFALARFLMPDWPDLYIKEGSVWLGAGEPDFAFDIWKEGIQRLSTPNAFYSDLYPYIKDDTELRERWRLLGQANKICTLIFLQNATPAEFQLELGRILGDDPELREFTPAELTTLFTVWYQKGEKLSLAETLRAHPAWEKIGWRQLARVYGDYQDYRQAYEILVRFAGVQWPDLSPNESVESLVTRFRVSGGERDGLILARAEAGRGQIDDALAVAAVLSGRPHPSPLVSALEAELWARKQDWAKAFQSMWKYVEQAKR